jgi:hypothetical protein
MLQKPTEIDSSQLAEQIAARKGKRCIAVKEASTMFVGLGSDVQLRPARKEIRRGKMNILSEFDLKRKNH